jgi:hypothetical protein
MPPARAPALECGKDAAPGGCRRIVLKRVRKVNNALRRWQSALTHPDTLVSMARRRSPRDNRGCHGIRRKRL